MDHALSEAGTSDWELAEAIDRSDLFIAIVSEACKASSACMWELHRAVARRFGDDPLRVVPLRVGDLRLRRMTEQLQGIQVVGSLLSEVVLSDRTPRQMRPWVVQRAVTSARASLGYVMRRETLPVATFPGVTEFARPLGQGRRDGRSARSASREARGARNAERSPIALKRRHFGARQ
ncbi:MAG: toll/interleukin-1 receptor domain-containing protein [Gaiellaceae bacterium]